MIEQTIYSTLKDLVEGRVYPDITPDNPQFPLITYQQVGGQAYVYLEQKLPDHKNSRLQVNVWAKTRLEANNIARQAEGIIIENIIPSEPLGAFNTLHEESLGIYGTRQDFSIWYTY